VAGLRPNLLESSQRSSRPPNCVWERGKVEKWGNKKLKGQKEREEKRRGGSERE